ncbi:hypothetical protein [Methylobacterium sp. JK268]
MSDAARAAYEARWTGMTLGPRGAAPAWDDLEPEGRAVWGQVAAAARADLAARVAEVEAERDDYRLAAQAEASERRRLSEQLADAGRDLLAAETALAAVTAERDEAIGLVSVLRAANTALAGGDWRPADDVTVALLARVRVLEEALADARRQEAADR